MADSLVSYLRRQPHARKMLEILGTVGSMWDYELRERTYAGGSCPFGIAFGGLLNRDMVWVQGHHLYRRRVGITMRGRRELVRWRTSERAAHSRCLPAADAKSASGGPPVRFDQFETHQYQRTRRPKTN
ncbi:hypothetical protein ATK86_3877 [Nocardia fluminea]|uniref:Uncharacterized protein n=1 Tax=Nocardia fluminea TaxID=134984 RepID=A0A2N3VCX0_9NOCA|nr:hypothetical protein ATK86_3877 [Nocardia fluminea]